MAGCIDTVERIQIRNQNHLRSNPDFIEKSNAIFAVQLRKSKRLNVLNKKRMQPPSNVCYYKEISALFPQYLLIYSESDAISFLFALLTHQSNLQLQCIILDELKEKIINYSDKAHKEFINDTNFQIILSFLSNESCEIIQKVLDLIVNLINISDLASEILLKFGFYSECAKIMLKNNLSIAHSAIWCFSNMAGSKISVKQRLINYGALDFLLGFINKMTNISQDFITLISWTFRNFSSNSKHLPKTTLENMIQIQFKFINNHSERVIKDILASIYFLLSSNSEYISTVLDSGITIEIISLINSSNLKISLMALSICGIVSSSEFHDFTQKLLDLDILSKLSQNIYHRDKIIRKQVYFILSNIVAGTNSQRNAVINGFIFMKSFKGLIDSDSEVRKECGYVFNNLAKTCTDSEIGEIFRLNVLDSLIDALKQENFEDIIWTLLKFTKRLVKCCKSMISEAKEAEILEILENLEVSSPITSEILEISSTFSKIISESPPHEFSFT